MTRVRKRRREGKLEREQVPRRSYQPPRSEEGRRVKQADALLRMNGLNEHTPSFIPHSSLLSITQEDTTRRPVSQDSLLSDIQSLG